MDALKAFERFRYFYLASRGTGGLFPSLRYNLERCAGSCSPSRPPAMAAAIEAARAHLNAGAEIERRPAPARPAGARRCAT
jgi:hypothetical protein